MEQVCQGIRDCMWCDKGRWLNGGFGGMEKKEREIWGHEKERMGGVEAS